MNLIEFIEKFRTDEECYEHLAKIKSKVICQKCGTTMYRLSHSRKYQCRKFSCNHQQTLKCGTIFYRSSTPLHKWFLAMYFIANSKKGLSSNQLARQIRVTYKTAWRMMQQIRKLMKEDLPMFKGISEVDETYVGGRVKGGWNNGWQRNKTMVVGILNRDTGKIKATIGKSATEEFLTTFIFANVEKHSRICSDERRGYRNLSLCYQHDTVCHSRWERAVGDVYTNTLEGFWSLLKRGIRGIYHRVSKQWMQAYVDEFVWRYNNRKEDNLFGLLLNKV